MGYPTLAPASEGKVFSGGTKKKSKEQAHTEVYGKNSREKKPRRKEGGGKESGSLTQKEAKRGFGSFWGFEKKQTITLWVFVHEGGIPLSF